MAETTDTGRLTTHVLDTANGRPAAGVQIDLFRADGDTRAIVKSIRTNADGRADEPMLAGADFKTGTYELVFHVGDYFASAGMNPEGPRFLDTVPVRFGIDDAVAHYHVPLLISPFGYSTYRGS